MKSSSRQIEMRRAFGRFLFKDRGARRAERVEELEAKTQDVRKRLARGGANDGWGMNPAAVGRVEVR